MSASRPESTAWPIPAEASTTTDSAVTARRVQRGRRRGGPGAGRGRRRCGGGPPRAGAAGTRREGERGGVGKGTPPRGLARAYGRGIVSTVGRYDLRPGPVDPAPRIGVPRSR
ncbi:hypothetical protein GCM10018772_33300 [Streptomyces fumanus]|uniref:Uncharacterized protein n=1 Tax=Streptomyces fumanus TaxID=67302 RepID=A0A919AGA0_9ACTN|nr:hypothetical protein GCM10018772_33300 [Streptomyces fumanus]